MDSHPSYDLTSFVTDRAIFTYDLDRQEVRREDNRRRHGGSGPSTKQDGGLVHAPASNNRGALSLMSTLEIYC